jgi:plastin-1
VYATLLHEIDPAACSADVAAIEDPVARTAAVIESARSLEVPVMVQAADIASGNRKLNLAFVAQIFNTRHGLEVKNLTEAEAVAMKEAFDAAGLDDDAGAGDEGDAREERVFRMWMNSLNLGGGEVPPLHRLFDDLQDGIALVETAVVVAPEETAAAQGARKLNKGEKLKSNKCVGNGTVGGAV